MYYTISLSQDYCENDMRNSNSNKNKNKKYVKTNASFIIIGLERYILCMYALIILFIN